MDEKKADLAKFLSDAIMKKGKSLPERYELVTGGGFSDATDARSTRRDDVMLQGNHEEADTRLILHSCEAVNEGYQRLLVTRKDTDVMLLLVHIIDKNQLKCGLSLEWQRKRNVTQYMQYLRDFQNLGGITCSDSVH